MSDANTNTDVLSVIIAGLSVLVSVIALLFSRHASQKAKQAQDVSNELQKQNNILQERMVQLEEARQQDAVIDANKAMLTARLVRVDKEYKNSNFTLPRTETKLEIKNTGRATAKNVRAFILGKSITEYPNIRTGNVEHHIIGPNSDVSYPMIISRGEKPPFQFSVTWEDDSGVPGKYETTLT